MSSQPYGVISGIVASLRNGDFSSGIPALLTLHFLFPHELLPALDLLDRRLVTQLIITDSLDILQQNEVYYVQSASATTSRPTKLSRHKNATGAAYEVRLSAWNCSCPAFAFSAFGKNFQATMNLDEFSNTFAHQDVHAGADTEARLGGVRTQASTGIPICKHVLAAFLGTAAPTMCGSGVCKRDVDRVEAAGWAGGWGD